MRRAWRLLILVVVIGFFIGFGSGLVENDVGFVDVPENRYYGFPVAWRAVNAVTGEKQAYPFELFLDCSFGAVMAAIVAVAAILTMHRFVNKATRANRNTQSKPRKAHK